MKLGVHFMNFTLPGGPEALAGTIADTAKAADEYGFSNMTFMDHYFQMERFSDAHDPMLEGYASLGYVAALTERIQLSLLVTGVTYRYPGLLAKIIATIDVLSGGRAMLGIGAAWYEREHLGLGVPYPPMRERYERLEETIEICRQMWSDDEGPYEGKYYKLAETICVPAPIQPGGPPVMIGGSGEKKTLLLVARHADACNLFTAGPDVVAHKLEVLRGHCEAEGRDYDAIEKTMLYSSVGNPDPIDDADGFVEQMKPYAELGITKVWSAARGDDPAGWVTAMGQRVVPKLAAV